jgi:hypothetical protein
MTRRTLLSAPLLLAAVPAAAAKIEIQMTPKALDFHGFSLKQKRVDDGYVTFELVRDMAKSQWPAHTLYLKVSSEAGRVMQCALEAEKRKNTLRYWFKIAPEHVRHSSLSYWEVQTADGTTEGEKVIGGGTIYDFRLAEFVEEPAGK